MHDGSFVCEVESAETDEKEESDECKVGFQKNGKEKAQLSLGEFEIGVESERQKLQDFTRHFPTHRRLIT